MTFLAAIAANLIKWIVTKLALIAWAWLRYVWAKNKDHKELKEKIEKLENAKTPEERNAAFDDLLKHF